MVKPFSWLFIGSYNLLLVSSEQYREALRESKNSFYDDASPSNTELAAVVSLHSFFFMNKTHITI